MLIAVELFCPKYPGLNVAINYSIFCIVRSRSFWFL